MEEERKKKRDQKKEREKIRKQVQEQNQRAAIELPKIKTLTVNKWNFIDIISVIWKSKTSEMNIVVSYIWFSELGNNKRKRRRKRKL